MYNVLKFQAPFDRIKEYNNESGEVTLYKAIIVQAIIDATNVATDKTNKAMKDEALDWIFQPSKSFVNICSNADLNPLTVRNLTLNAIDLQNTKRRLDQNIYQYIQNEIFNKGVNKTTKLVKEKIKKQAKENIDSQRKREVPKSVLRHYKRIFKKNNLSI